MVVNLGANAIRFTGAGGRVVVRVIDAGPEFELQVEDPASGFPPTRCRTSSTPIGRPTTLAVGQGLD